MEDQTLAAFVDSVCKTSHLRVEDDLGGGFVRLRSDEAERRQAAHDIRSTEDVVIEMLRNSRDAGAKNVFMAVTRDGNTRRIVMVDDGCGIPASMHERVFEPRVTSKLDTMHLDRWGVHGRGMALFSITANASLARVAASEAGLGAAIVVETDLTKLSEKTDQSTFPTFELTESGAYSMRGPRNVLRTASEFALECRHDCTVYTGSAIDIAATLYEFGRATTSAATRAFCTNTDDLPVCKRLAVATTPAEFVDVATELGLVLSERSARRVMDGEIPPLDPLLDRIRTEGFDAPAPVGDDAATTGARLSAASKRKHKHASDARGLKLSPEDTRVFANQVKDAFAELAPRYYLEADVRPEVRVSKGALHITIPVEKLR